MCIDISGITLSVLPDSFIFIIISTFICFKRVQEEGSSHPGFVSQKLSFSLLATRFLCFKVSLDCLLTGGLAVLLCAAWWFWYWHSTTWACCAAPWGTTSTPHRQHEAASQTREERCSLRECPAWIQTVKQEQIS